MLWADHVARNTAGERDDVFSEARSRFDDAELIEVTLACGLFALSNRVQDSLRIPLEDQGEVDKIRHSVSSARPERIKAYLEHLVREWRSGAQDDEVAATPAATLVPQDTAGSRLPLLDPASAPGESARLLRAAARLQGGLTNVARTFAHAPYVAKLWLPFPVALEREGLGGTLPVRVKCLAMLRTAHLRSSPYSIAHRAALARAAGIDEKRLAALASDGCAESDLFTAGEQAAIRWAEHVAPNTAKRHDPVFAALRPHYAPGEIVELTGACAMANQMALMQNALRIPLEPDSVIEAVNHDTVITLQRARAYIEALLAEWPAEFPATRAT